MTPSYEKKSLMYLNRQFEEEEAGMDLDEEHKRLAQEASRSMDEAILRRMKEDRMGRPTDEEEKEAEAEYEEDLPDDDSVDIDWDALDSDEED